MTGGKDDYDDQLIAAADAIVDAVTEIYDAAEVAQEIVTAAVGLSDAAEGPPDRDAMIKLNAVAIYLRRAVVELDARWSDLNRAGQDWTVVFGKPHYYADPTTIDDDALTSTFRELGLTHYYATRTDGGRR